MPRSVSPCSFPSDLEENIDYYTREDYWSEYDFYELLDDIEVTVYSSEAQALDILEALERTAEEEDLELSEVTTFRTRLALNYRAATSPWEHITIRFRPTEPSSNSSDSATES